MRVNNNMRPVHPGEILADELEELCLSANALAVRRLTILDNAESLRDLAGLPSNRLEALSGERAGEYSIRINLQWRICFRWGEDGPYEVSIVDYHR